MTDVFQWITESIGKSTSTSAPAPPQPSLSPASNTVLARYVRFRRTNNSTKEPVSFQNLRVIGAQNEIIVPTTCDMSSVYQKNPNLGCASASDGSFATLVHTEFEPTAWVRLDLGKEVPVTAVILDARSDGGGEPPGRPATALAAPWICSTRRASRLSTSGRRLPRPVDRTASRWAFPPQRCCRRVLSRTWRRAPKRLHTNGL